MTSKTVTQWHAHSCQGEKRHKGAKTKSNRRLHYIATNERKTSGEEGEQEVAGVHGPPAHSGLGNICSGVAKD